MTHDNGAYVKYADKSCLAWNSQGGECYWKGECRCARQNRPSFYLLRNWLNGGRRNAR